MFNALVVDDLPMFCHGLRRIIKKIPVISKCDVTSDGMTALEAIGKNAYDILLMDLHLQGMNGYDLVETVAAKHPSIKIVIISMVETKREVMDILQKGVSAYLLKSAGELEIAGAIELVLNGHIYMSEKIQRMWTDFILGKSTRQKLPAGRIELSMREKEIIRLICSGHTAIDIANKLCISEATVKNHRSNIMKKLDTDNAIGIAMYAVKTGLYVP